MSTVNLTKQTINLSKGQKINLSKESNGLKSVTIGLGWDPAKKGFISSLLGTSTDIDCDAWLVMLEDGSYRDSDKLIYYRNLEYIKHGETVVKHTGDNLTGEGEGDDEQIIVNFDKVPKSVNAIVVGVTIFAAEERMQSFSKIQNTFIRVVDNKDNFEICKYNQSDMSQVKNATTFIAGRFIKNNGDWEFEALGEGIKCDKIKDVVKRYQ